MPKIPFKTLVNKLRKPIKDFVGGAYIHSRSVFGDIHLLSRMKERNVNIADTIKSLGDEFKEYYGLKTAEDINDGYCLDFAEALQQHTGGSVVGTNENADHFFLYWKGKYYDAETPEGVKHLENLPIWNTPHRIGRGYTGYHMDKTPIFKHVYKRKRIPK